MTTAQNTEKVMTDLIREHNKTTKATREELATAAGLSPKTYDRYMAGVAGAPTFTVPHLINIAGVLGVPLSALMPADHMQDAA